MRTRTISKVSRWIAPFLQILLFSAALLGTEAAFAEDNPPARVARISYFKGKVSFEPAGHGQWSEATRNFTVTTGDRIYTDKDARAELEVGPYSVCLSSATDLLVTNLAFCRRSPQLILRLYYVCANISRGRYLPSTAPTSPTIPELIGSMHTSVCRY